MARSEQRNDKANKKPKKDSGSSSKDTSSSSSVSTRPVAPTTAVLPKGKLKKKLG